MTLLDNLAAHNRAAIEGAAGTGKTVLAMEKARRLATTGRRVLLLCFNSPLAQDLAAYGRGIGVAAGGGRMGPPSGSEYIAFALPESPD